MKGIRLKNWNTMADNGSVWNIKAENCKDQTNKRRYYNQRNNYNVWKRKTVSTR